MTTPRQVMKAKYHQNTEKQLHAYRLYNGKIAKKDIYINQSKLI